MTGTQQRTKTERESRTPKKDTTATSSATKRHLTALAGDVPDGWSAVPEVLLAERAWVCWQYEQRADEVTKVPKQITGAPASTTDPNTWVAFEVVAEHAELFDGIGFVLGNGFAGADLDNALDAEGRLKPWAAPIVAALNSYTEISPSAVGVKVFFSGELPNGGKQTKLGDGKLELYSSRRYFTVTGWHLESTPTTIELRQTELTTLLARVWPEPQSPAAKPPPTTLTDLSAEELLQKVFASKNGSTIRQLFDAPGANGNSEGDASLCAHLAFWSMGDAGRLERWLRQSNRMRPKWDTRRGSETWIGRECRQAVENCADFYSPPKQRTGSVPNGDGEEEDAAVTGADDPVAVALRDYSDAGNAALLVALFGDRLRYDHARARWLLWSGHWWIADDTERVLRLGLEAAHHRYQAAWNLPEDQQRAAVKFAVNSRAHHRLVSALAIAKALPPIADAGKHWDQQPHLFAVRNGVVNLRTGKLESGKPEDRITRHVDLDFDADAECPRWRRFLSEVMADDAELMEFVRLAIGYSLTGSMAEQCFFVCYGTGSNGKSVLVETIGSVLGPYATGASFEAFTDNPGHSESLAKLAGARFVTSAELRENTRLNEQRLKTLAHGNDILTAAMKYGHEFDFVSTAKLWLCVNHRPRVTDDAEGFWRSVRLVPFRCVFSPKTEPDLADKLADERAGILRWCIQATADWYQHGVPDVEQVMAASGEWRSEADPLLAFLEDRCVIAADATTVKPDAWLTYVAWCDEQALPQRERLSHAAFSRRMKDRFGVAQERRKTGRVRIYCGIGLLADSIGEDR